MHNGVLFGFAVIAGMILTILLAEFKVFPKRLEDNKKDACEKVCEKNDSEMKIYNNDVCVCKNSLTLEYKHHKAFVEMKK